jgi:hypothetical protein
MLDTDLWHVEANHAFQFTDQVTDRPAVCPIGGGVLPPTTQAPLIPDTFFSSTSPAELARLKCMSHTLIGQSPQPGMAGIATN